MNIRVKLKDGWFVRWVLRGRNGSMENDEKNVVAVIMAGGAGTRFWPLSTEAKPKQFLNLFDDRSLLQKSFDRIAGLISHHRILILTNAAFVPLVREQLPQVPAENIIGEPLRRDTAAAVTLGAVLCRKRYGNPVIITLTADHVIEPIALFHRTLLSAARLARASGALYTFGIRPTYPATGYGYLELGEKVAEDDDIEHFQLLRFQEKPDLETARNYLTSNRFFWNSGMFVWTAEAILHELETHIPKHLSSLSRACEFEGGEEWSQALAAGFDSLEAISIDFAVMEKARDVRCVVSDFFWTDVGGWLALRDFLPSDADGNSYRGQITTLNAADNLVFSNDPEEEVMLIGVNDLIVVRTDQKTLVIHKDRTQEIKILLQKRKDRK
jgi:mannose-1-phosphate guanylyltransferase